MFFRKIVFRSFWAHRQNQLQNKDLISLILAIHDFSCGHDLVHQFREKFMQFGEHFGEKIRAKIRAKFGVM